MFINFMLSSVGFSMGVSVGKDANGLGVILDCGVFVGFGIGVCAWQAQRMINNKKKREEIFSVMSGITLY